MSKWKYLVGSLGVLAVAGAVAVKQFPLQSYAVIDSIKHPVAPPQKVTWSPGPTTPPAQKGPPNIILIVADDLGINDLTSTGAGVAGGLVPTPNIDSLARQGANFSQGYAAHATCSPSRAAMMTGRYPTRFGFEFTAVPVAFARNLGEPVEGRLRQPIYHHDREKDVPSLDDMGVPSNQITIAEALKARGYRTLHIGKWHLGEAPKLRPEGQGFDESLGFMGGAAKFLPGNDPNVVNAKLEYDPIDKYLWAIGSDAVQWNGGQRFHVPEYMTDYFSHQAVAAIEANRNRPFFMYLAYNAPHTPFQAKRSDYEALSNIKDHKARVYGAMIRALDRGVGEVLAALKRNGLDNNTMVIFTSDNGGAWYAGLPDINAPYRGWKATFFEGGIRVPFFIRWPGKIPAGGVYPTVAHHADIFATTAAAAGAQVPGDRKMDGIDLLPVAEQKISTQRIGSRTLFWRSGDYAAVRDGNWKLQMSANPRKVWLYDLSTDPTERKNLAQSRPDQVQRMKNLLSAHHSGLPKPLWPALVEEAVRVDQPSDALWSANQEYIYWAN